ncbi:MAG: hypothetical protein J7L45_01830 [Candidatus Aenigmarchaeota archaeon]|nr:hypothetical protein [Candidatus Aenigmarchaeota archaeon]
MDLEKLREVFKEHAKKEIGLGDPWLDEDFNEFKNMIEALDVKEGDILYVGAGTGFGVYVLSELLKDRGKIYAYEIDPNNIEVTKKNLDSLKDVMNYDNIILKECDGFIHNKKVDNIVITAGAPYEQNEQNSELYEYLESHLNVGGKTVIPFGHLGKIYHDVVCIGKAYGLENVDGKITSKVISDHSGMWYPLRGRYGFSDEKIQRVQKEPPLVELI